MMVPLSLILCFSITTLNSVDGQLWNPSFGRTVSSTSVGVGGSTESPRDTDRWIDNFQLNHDLYSLVTYSLFILAFPPKRGTWWLRKKHQNQNLVRGRLGEVSACCPCFISSCLLLLLSPHPIWRRNSPGVLKMMIILTIGSCCGGRDVNVSLSISTSERSFGAPHLLFFLFQTLYVFKEFGRFSCF